VEGTRIWKKLKAHKAALAAVVVLGLFLFLALFANWIAPLSPTAIHENQFLLPPVWKAGGANAFWLGTDDVGRDILSRLIYGARISLGVGFCAVVLSLIVGIFFGVWAGFAGGRADRMISGGVDILMSLPNILLAIVVVAILGPSLLTAIFAVSVVAVPGLIRVVRATVLAEKEKLYVHAAVSFGSPSLRLIFKNILPNCLGPIIVQATLGFSDAILNAAALGFLGLGAQPPTPEWGVMLADGRSYIESASWLVTLPGICILFVSLSFNILGDGLRDALDPKLK